MTTLWFAIAAVMVAIYVVMDGFDLGAGGLHLLVAHTDRERRQVLAAIGPFWDGNEVWLLAAGGVLFLAFPAVLAAGLSGFYLAIFLVLWTLILRGIAIEFRSHIEDRLWRSFWDATFALASTLASVLFGAALGNLLRGVPLTAEGWFALPLFDSFSPTGALGLLDWYTILVGLFALVTILHHGALFLAWRTDGEVRRRSLDAAARLFPATFALWILATVATARLAPEIPRHLAERPVAWLATALFLVGLGGTWFARRAGRDLLAFLASCAFVLGLLAATAAALFPTMIRSTTIAAALTAQNSAAAHSLRTGLLWWPAGFLLAAVYTIVLFRLHRGKTQAAADGEGY